MFISIPNQTGTKYTDFTRIVGVNSRYVQGRSVNGKIFTATQRAELVWLSWCCRTGLNCRPLPYQGSALPLSYGSEEGRRRDGGANLPQGLPGCKELPLRQMPEPMDRRCLGPDMRRYLRLPCRTGYLAP